MSATRILLADDYAMVRLGLRTILENHQEYEVCGEAGDGSQTLALAYQLAPDILIVDISMPGPNGLEVSAQLREAMPTTKVLIITMHDTEEMLRAAAAAGASGYLLKSDSEELLLVALQRLEQGHAFVSPAFGFEARQLFELEAV